MGTIGRSVSKIGKRDLVVIWREKTYIVFYQSKIVANPSESLTLPRPFIFLLRLCA